MSCGLAGSERVPQIRSPGLDSFLATQFGARALEVLKMTPNDGSGPRRWDPILLVSALCLIAVGAVGIYYSVRGQLVPSFVDGVWGFIIGFSAGYAVCLLVKRQWPPSGRSGPGL